MKVISEGSKQDIDGMNLENTDISIEEFTKEFIAGILITSLGVKADIQKNLKQKEKI